MTDELDTEDDIDEQEDYIDPKAVRQLRQELKQANKRAKDADDLRARVTDYERREAVRQAGLDLSEKKMKALLAAHEGDTLTAESVKATAIDLGWAKEDTEPSEEEQAVERMRLNTGGGNANVSRDWDAEYASATSPEDVIRIARERGVPIAADLD